VQSYKICPRQYKYRYVLKVPSKSSAALSYGNSVHNTLKDFFEIIRRSNDGMFKEKVTVDKLLDIYSQKWISSGYLNKEHEKEAFNQGKASLKKFFEKFVDMKQKPFFLEKSFSLPVGNIRVRGKIDRIDSLDEGGHEIIDYKTGDNLPGEKEADKNEQLAIYALACEKVFGIKAKYLSLLFIDHNVKLTTDADTIKKIQEKVVKQIGEVAEKIDKEEFIPTPGFMCRYCDYNSICKYAKL
jgi:DNA helicase-2/ATP-dependent DNA helicase PcrA